MRTASSTIYDPARLDALRRTGLLDSPHEEVFDRLTRLASKILKAPMAMVSLVDDDRQWLKSCVGLPEPWVSGRQTPLAHSFCQHVVATGEPLVVPDARTHPLPCDNRAIPDLGVVAYAGFPLTTSDGYTLGAFCAMDGQPRAWSEEEIDLLRELTTLVMSEIELRAQAREARSQVEQVESDHREKVALLEATGEGIYGVDPQGRCTFINRAGAQMLGYSSEELAGRSMHALIHHSRPDGSPYPEVECPICRCFEVGQGCRLEDEVVWRRDGSSFAAEYTSYPLFEDGAIRGGVVTFDDISRRQQAELRLAVQYTVSRVLAEAPDFAGAATQMLQSIGEAFDWPLGLLWSVDTRENILCCRQIWQAPSVHAEAFQVVARQVRFTPDVGLPGRVWASGEPAWIADLVKETSSPGAPAAIQAGLHGAFAFPIQLGREILGVIEFFSADIRPPDEELLRTVSALGNQIGQFIERKRAEENLSESEIRNRAILETALDGIITIDHESRVTEWNPAAEQAFGYSRAEAVGQDLAALIVPPSLRDLHRQGLERFLAMDEGPVSGQRIEITGMRADGSEFPVEMAIRRIPRDGPPMFTGFVRDITERRRAEEMLQRAKEAAEAADRAKSQFLAHMSHEIRTPMNAIIGMSGLVLDTDLNAEQREFAEIIRHSADSLLTVINEILDFSKIEAGELLLERQPFDLRECVEASLDLLAVQAAEKGLELACLIEPQTLEAVVGDITRLRQILVNLVSNGVKFTERGEVIVSLSSRPLPDGRYELHFEVSDTGIGIPLERMDRLFRSFSQVDASTTRRYGGTGLGLVISKRLSELMGGTMWVESEVGKATTFHFTIMAEAASRSWRAASYGDQSRLMAKRVLIVDDNATNRRILSLQTQSWGMRPRETAHGPEALEWIRGEPFDVAILDIQMPEMDGITLAHEIRKLPEARSLPLVALSSLGRQEADAEEGLFHLFLTKPIKQSQLYDVLVGLFAGQAVAVREPSRGSDLAAPFAERVPLRILLAEDMAVNQKLMLILLGRMGYRADVAANGHEVLAALQRQPYDVVLMDVQMPEMDGLEAARRICEQWPADRRPRIVALTAHAMQGDREACEAAGMDDYLAKPVQVKQLQEALYRTGQWAQESQLPALGSQLSAMVSHRDESTRGAAAPPAESREPGAESGSVATLDPAVLADLRQERDGGEPGVFRDLLELFQADALPLLAVMRAAATEGNPQQLMHASHGLKGVAANLGARSLSRIAADLEAIGRNPTMEGAEALLSAAEAEFQRVCEALEAEAGGT